MTLTVEQYEAIIRTVREERGPGFQISMDGVEIILREAREQWLGEVREALDELRKLAVRERAERLKYAEKMSPGDPMPGFNSAVCMGSESAYNEAAKILATFTAQDEQ